MDKKDIILVEEMLITAMTNGDVKELNKLIHDDLLFTIPSGQLITKEMDLDNYRSGNMKIEAIIARDQTINLIEDTAVVSVVVEMKGSFLGQSMDGTYRFLRVWKSEDGQIKIIAGSSSLL